MLNQLSTKSYMLNDLLNNSCHYNWRTLDIPLFVLSQKNNIFKVIMELFMTSFPIHLGGICFI